MSPTKQVSRDKWMRSMSSGWRGWLLRLRMFGPRELLDAWWTCNRYRHWLALPLRCKRRHNPKVVGVYECEGMYLHYEYRECVRCGDWLGYVER